ncbi:MAG: 50S ribosomal protein L21 [Fimbriimonadaceae bacterium]
MYAIVKTGGKQYRAEKNETFLVDKLVGEAGSKIDLPEVVMVCDGDKVAVGSPFVKGASVKAEIVRQVKAKKIDGFNYKAKKNERKRWGHRAELTEIRITEVKAG